MRTSSRELLPDRWLPRPQRRTPRSCARELSSTAAPPASSHSSPTLDQPETQDPLGLTPRRFRKSAAGPRRGIPVQHPQERHPEPGRSRSRLETGRARHRPGARLYVGDRQVTQYLAIPLAVQAPRHVFRRRRRSRPWLWRRRLRWSHRSNPETSIYTSASITTHGGAPPRVHQQSRTSPAR